MDGRRIFIVLPPNSAVGSAGILFLCYVYVTSSITWRLGVSLGEKEEEQEEQEEQEEERKLAGYLLMGCVARTAT